MSKRRETTADRAERSIKRDSVKDAIGKLTGNVGARAEGKAEHAGKAEQPSPKSDAKPGSTRTP